MGGDGCEGLDEGPQDDHSHDTFLPLPATSTEPPDSENTTRPATQRMLLDSDDSDDDNDHWVEITFQSIS